jgi:hypothetical protein
MEWIRKNLVGLLLIIVCIAGVVLYQNYFSGSDADLLTSDINTNGEEMLIALNKLRAISFDQTLFSDPVFLSLVDFGTDIAPKPIGRPNPFAPIGLRTQSAGPNATGAR